ncbi:trypsin-like serine protease [Paenibacillus chitinolyticus]|uniref:trypsin-like serine protease n=1 Tax=Paenibacillus chitinolyticus TaxID=79263 RepID=UPI00364B415C
MFKKISFLFFSVSLLCVSFSSGSSKAADITSQEVEAKVLPIVRDKIASLYGDLRKFEETGSLYIEQNSEGKSIVIGYIKDDKLIEDLTKNIKSAHPTSRIKFKQIKYSYDQLKKIKDEIVEEWPNLKKKGTYPLEISIDDINQKVIFTVSKTNTETKNELQQKYGEVLQIIEDPLTEINSNVKREDNFGTLGGGIGLQMVRDKVYVCTTAGTATKNGVRFIITAGHCLKANQDIVSQFSNYVGKDHYSGLVAGTGIDIGLVKIEDNNRWITSKILKNSPSPDYDAKYISTGAFTGGETVCKAGLETNYTCGSVISTSTDITLVDGRVIKDTAKIYNTNYDINNKICDASDSGAPLWTGDTLKGVLSSGVEKGPQAGKAIYAAKIIYTPDLFGSEFKVYTSTTGSK